MPKFIEGFADKLVVPAGARDVQVFDDELGGFGLRKFASGHAAHTTSSSMSARSSGA